MPLTLRLLAAGAAGLVLAATAVAPAPATAAPPAYDTTTALEARRVAAVKTPALHWYNCYASWSQCATAKVPLDYDHPNGPQTEIALLRVKAKDQKHRIGSLFVNPGGPGGSATQFALMAPLFLSDRLLARFDVVGMDPRGIGFSTNVNCFGTAGNQAAQMKGMEPLFPVGAKQEKAYIAAAQRFGRACSTTGRPLSGSMSTAEVARDMEVMRRAVGDSKLTYLGFSYGTALGQYYANMFPDRMRAIAVDGVIDPVAWVGSRGTRKVVQDVRLGSAEGAYRAFVEIMRRCDRAGIRRCPFADGSPLARYATVANRLKAKPVRLAGSTYTYADLVGETLNALYTPVAGDLVAMIAQDMWTLTDPKATRKDVAAARASAGRRRLARAFPYDNSFDGFAAVTCTDGWHPAKAANWPAKVARSEKAAPYFGAAWAWATVQCARDTWTVQDEDAYTGPFDRRTRKTVLVVGSWWDPATNYRQAVKSAALLPNSRLLSSRNWGHTAYGTSACVTGAIDTYLLEKRMPPVGKVCVGDDQPFTSTGKPLAAERRLGLATASISEIAAAGLPPAGAEKQLPPVDRRF